MNANRGLSEEERKRRLEHIHACYHAEIEACLSRRVDAGVPTAIIAIHSFTPVYFGNTRPWEVGSYLGRIAVSPIF